jgi:hypothetical protein
MTPDAGQVRSFRTTRWVAVAAAVSAGLFLAGAVLCYWLYGLTSWLTVVFLCLVPLGLAGVADVVTQRVELHAERMVVVRNLRRREYPRRLFVKAQWSKGAPVSLQTTAGEWVNLPGVGTSNQGLANTLRAWIQR